LNIVVTFCRPAARLGKGSPISQTPSSANRSPNASGVAPVHGVGEPGREVADLGINREAFDGLLKAGIHVVAFLRSLPGRMV
jgi:hypothetical protein